MTRDAQRRRIVVEALQATFDDNVTYFAKNRRRIARRSPELDLLLAAVEEATDHRRTGGKEGASARHRHLGDRTLKTRIAVDSVGRIDLVQDGVRLYRGDAVTASGDELGELPLSAVVFEPPNESCIPERPYETTAVESRLRSLIAGGSEGNRPFEGYHLGGDYLPLLTVLGLGLGYHLEHLAQVLEIAHLVLYEPNPEVLPLTLYTINWQTVLDGFLDSGRRIVIVPPAPTMREASYRLMNTINRAHPALKNIVLTYRHGSWDRAGELADALRDNVFFEPHTLYYDSRTELKNTVANVRRKPPLYSGRGSVPKNAVAFVAAAGPSLDKSIDTIRKHQPKAVVFSCGTALRCLHRAGLCPDFQVEVDRGDTKSVLESIGDREYLDGLTVIGSTTVPLATLDLFGSHLIFFLSRLLLPRDMGMLTFAYPLVGNAAASLALALGFRHVYLFGTDFGTADAEQHHSKDTAYYGSDGPRPPVKSFDTAVEGNFGNTVHTSRIYTAARTCLEALLIQYRDAEVLNCSDGLRVEGAAPLRPGQVRLGRASAGKATAIRRVKSQFTRNYRRRVRWPLRQVLRDLEALNRTLTPVLSSRVTNRAEVVDVLFEAHRCVEGRLRKAGPETLTLALGTLQTFQNVIYTHTFAEADDAMALRFARKGLRALKAALEGMERDLRESFVES